MKRIFCSTLIIMAALVLSACAQQAPLPSMDVADVFTPTPQVLESTPVETTVPDTEVPVQAELFSSDRLGLCFSYPLGSILSPDSETVAIAAPLLPDANVEGRFWLEISDAYGRTAETIADQDQAYNNGLGLKIGRWTVDLGGEQSVVLDGMSGQELQRRVYVVRDQKLYMLGFWPARSENQAAVAQMEELFAEITNSWAWTPCSASE